MNGLARLRGLEWYTLVGFIPLRLLFSIVSQLMGVKKLDIVDTALVLLLHLLGKLQVR